MTAAEADVLVEVYEYPDGRAIDGESIEEFCEELEFYFKEEFSAECLTDIDDMWDSDTNTFKLLFHADGKLINRPLSHQFFYNCMIISFVYLYDEDAEIILKADEQSLLGDEEQMIKLRRVEPLEQTTDKVLVKFLTGKASVKIVEAALKKHGNIKSISRLADGSYLVVFNNHQGEKKIIIILLPHMK